MHDLVTRPSIPAMSPAAIARVREIERLEREKPQVPIHTTHLLHRDAGLYVRTVLVPAGVRITSVLIKIATVLIVDGHAVVYLGDEKVELQGHADLAAAAGRKQVIEAIVDTYLTMIFATKARTVEEAEREFTDETDLLASHRDGLNDVIVTGE